MAEVERARSAAIAGHPYAAAAARVLGAASGGTLALGGAFVALNEVLFHGFAAICSDGHPEFDPEQCGITWTSGVPSLTAAILGLVLLVLCVADTGFTSWLLLTVGSSIMLVAVYLLWVMTWFPLTPARSEPAEPQLVQLAVGAATTWAGLRIRRA
jgi:hypothetical protein